jgi:hypothetical protein
MAFSSTQVLALHSRAGICSKASLPLIPNGHIVDRLLCRLCNGRCHADSKNARNSQTACTIHPHRSLDASLLQRIVPIMTVSPDAVMAAD